MERVANVRPLKYTGKRKEEYDMYKSVFGRVRDIPTDVIKGLNSKEKRAVNAARKREEERDRKIQAEVARQLEELRKKEALKAAEKKLKAEEKAKKKRQAKMEAERVRDGVVLDKLIKDVEVFEQPGALLEVLQNDIEKIKDKTGLYMVVSIDGEITHQGSLTLTGKDAVSIYWNSIKPIFYPYGYEMGNTTAKEYVRVVIYDRDTAPSKKILQKYREGVKNCVIQPLIEMWSRMRDNSESEGSKARLGQIVRKLEKYLVEYENGVPEEDMGKIGQAISRCIIVKDNLNNTYAKYNEKSSKIVYFTNTRKDHLEMGELTIDGKFELVNEAELVEIIEEHKRDNVFYYIASGNFENPTNIVSVRGKWAIANKDRELYEQFNEETGVKNYGIDAVKYSDLNEFVLESRVINAAPISLCEEPNSIDGVNHMDLVKAYTQAKMSKYYEGYMGHIYMYGKVPAVFGDETAYALKFLKDKIGIFQVKILKNDNNKLRMLGIKVGSNYILPSVEIKGLIDMGCKVRLIAGCFGSRFDFDYTEEMLADGKYAIWAGKLGMDKKDNTYSFKCDDEVWVSHLKATLGDSSVFYFKKAAIVVVKVPKKTYKTRHHILAFITSYTRLNMLDIMMKVDDDKLVKVVMDGLYFRGDVPDVDVPHSLEKKKIEHRGFGKGWYLESEYDCSFWGNLNMEFDQKVLVLGGQGGTGKSYSVLANRTIVNPLYVVPTHSLGKKSNKVYGCRYTTINKLIGAKTTIKGKEVVCRPYREEYGEPGVIFIDELTMITKEWIDTAIKMYPDSLMFVAGDLVKTRKGILWGQTRNGHPGAFFPIWLGQGYKLLEYKDDMRSRDEQLKALKLKIREKMFDIFTEGGMLDALKINKWAEKEFNAIEFDDACKMFKEGDTWISATHKTNAKLLKAGVVSGYINDDREIVREDSEKSEKRGSFTTHSFQGMTIEYGKIFVSLDCFEYAMLYTAVSRGVNFDQIVFVKA